MPWKETNVMELKTESVFSRVFAGIPITLNLSLSCPASLPTPNHATQVPNPEYVL